MRLLLSRLKHQSPIINKSLIRFPGHRLSSSSTRISTPLRILFCGSDEFSCASLRALHEEHVKDQKFIASIDVLHQPPKLSGRGMKVKRTVPISAEATRLGLRVHYPDDIWTPTTVNLPTSENGQVVNLIIAVSFGIFIPSQVLNAVEYGGLNLHPSLLPNYRGAAPIQHAIMNNESYTGITLQTLSTVGFDRGIILAQTGPHEIPISAHTTTFNQLLDRITPRAASLLIKGLKDKVYIPPLTPFQPAPGDVDADGKEKKLELKLAPKLGPQDAEINWGWNAHTLIRRKNAIPKLWSTVLHPYIHPNDITNYRMRYKGTSSRLVFPGSAFEIVEPERVYKIMREEKQKTIEWGQEKGTRPGSCKLFFTKFSLKGSEADFSPPTSRQSWARHPKMKTVFWISYSGSSSQDEASSDHEREDTQDRKRHRARIPKPRNVLLLLNGTFLSVPSLIRAGDDINTAYRTLLPFWTLVTNFCHDAHTLAENQQLLERLREQTEKGLDESEKVVVGSGMGTK